MGHLERDQAEAAALGVSLNTLYRRRRGEKSALVFAWRVRDIMQAVLATPPGRNITTDSVQAVAKKYELSTGKVTARAWLVKYEAKGKLVKVRRGVWRVR